MDIIIERVRIIDGSGAPAFLGSVGMEQGRLRIFRGAGAPAAALHIDGAGLTAVPGFIDAHSHGDLTLVSPYAAASKLTQGITTQVAGQCGVSLFPCAPKETEQLRRFVAGIAPYPELPDDPAAACESAGTFFDWMERLQSPLTTRCFVGHGTLRLWAMGYASRRPDEGELKRMQAMLRRCLREGAMGLSTGLVYAPSCYADNDELLALLRVVHEEGGYYATHPRNEADTVIEARAEANRLAMEAGVPLCVSHLKAAGRANWGKPHRVLELIDRAVDDGLDALIDCYPYAAGNTSLNVSIPPRYFAKGLPGLLDALRSPAERAIIREEMSRPSDYDNYIYNSGGFSGTYVSSCPVFHDAEGMFITEYAEKTGQDPFDAYCDILLKNGGLGLGIYFHMSEDDVAEILAHPLCAVSTDGLIGLPSENPHPRSFGTMARAYRLMVHERRFCTPEQAIRKMTGLPAEKLRLAGKGLLRDGYDADVLLLDLDEFCDTATYAHGSGRCAGIRAVFCGGKKIDPEGKR